ncbi:MAG: transposase [Firmicutes bacterium]|nr:transposase [Bacillota bacterium]
MAWELKEEFRDILQMQDEKNVLQALNCWYERISNYKLTPFYAACKTIKRWEEKNLNYFDSGITNGFAEGINNKIKLVKRIGYGVPNIFNMKIRIFMSVLEI